MSEHAQIMQLQIKTFNQELKSTTAKLSMKKFLCQMMAWDNEHVGHKPTKNNIRYTKLIICQYQYITESIICMSELSLGKSMQNK